MSEQVTDRRGVVLVPGQKVFVLQTEQTRFATVVEVSESRSSNGWWVDVDFGRGPEGVPSDILEVCNAPSPSPQQPAEDPDEWVVLDPVKYADHVPRVGVDQFQSYEKSGEWITQREDHSSETVGDFFQAAASLHRCRRRDLPKVEQPQKTSQIKDEWFNQILTFDPTTGEYSHKPQPQKTRVRLWIEVPTKMVMCRDKAPYGDWQELHHDSEGFYVEQGQ